MTTLTLSKQTTAPPPAVDITAELRVKAAAALKSLASYAQQQAQQAPAMPVLAFAKPSADPRIDALLAELGVRFPLAFKKHSVLAVGVHKELCGLGYDKALVAAVLSRWCHSRAYTAALANGVRRRTLDGTKTDRVTPEQQQQAQALLASRKALVAAKRSKSRAPTSRKPQRPGPVVVVLNAPRQRRVLDLSKGAAR